MKKLIHLKPVVLFVAVSIFTGCYSSAGVSQIGATSKKFYHKKNVPNARSGQKYKIRF